MANPRPATHILWTALLLTVACNSEAKAGPSPAMTATASMIAPGCATPGPDELIRLSAGAITAKDSGKTLVLHQTDRISVYLDDGVYPLNELLPTPVGALGYISNGSVRGPMCYPIIFEAVTPGKVLLQDRGFRLEILIDNTAPRSTLLLP